MLNEKGVTRYVSSSLWSSINDEASPHPKMGCVEEFFFFSALTCPQLDELRKESQALTDDDSDLSDLDATPESADHYKALIDHQSFIFGYRSADVDLRPLHPLPSQIPFIWQVYQENVDPILKIVHVPTMGKTIKQLRPQPRWAHPSTEALMFSI